MGFMNILSGITGFGERATNFTEWFGIFSRGEREDGTTRLQRWDLKENYADVADATAEALKDGFQTSDIAKIGGTAAGAFLDHKVTTWIGNSFLSRIPIIGFFVRGLASFLGNSTQSVVENVVSAITGNGEARNDKSLFEKIIPKELRNLDLDGDGVPGTQGVDTQQIDPSSISKQKTEEALQPATT